ncbi:hypothetical protein [uncultured Adlercreutzia sp.]|uniref:hypothetical protein n=1 Tax=uncultured Adlercreutzia sp. TaxID=875803 RepID=UPI00272DE28B|nr:hypothetical protein [uncultured Adlercreutzia sp.]
MEPYAYRENLESILAFTNQRATLTIGEAAQYLGVTDTRTVRRRCPKTFVGGWGTAATFARELCDYWQREGRKRK